MSFLDKLHRNDLSREIRPDEELKKLFGKGKHKDREREQEQGEQEQQEGDAAKRLATIALHGSIGKFDVNADVEVRKDGVSIDGTADTPVPLGKKINANVGGEVHADIDKNGASVEAKPTVQLERNAEATDDAQADQKKKKPLQKLADKAIDKGIDKGIDKANEQLDELTDHATVSLSKKRETLGVAAPDVGQQAYGNGRLSAIAQRENITPADQTLADQAGGTAVADAGGKQTAKPEAKSADKPVGKIVDKKVQIADPIRAVDAVAEHAPPVVGRLMHAYERGHAVADQASHAPAQAAGQVLGQAQELADEAADVVTGGARKLGAQADVTAGHPLDAQAAITGGAHQLGAQAHVTGGDHRLGAQAHVTSGDHQLGAQAQVSGDHQLGAQAHVTGGRALGMPEIIDVADPIQQPLRRSAEATGGLVPHESAHVVQQRAGVNLSADAGGAALHLGASSHAANAEHAVHENAHLHNHVTGKPGQKGADQRLARVAVGNEQQQLDGKHGVKHPAAPANHKNAAKDAKVLKVTDGKQGTQGKPGTQNKPAAANTIDEIAAAAEHLHDEFATDELDLTLDADQDGIVDLYDEQFNLDENIHEAADAAGAIAQVRGHAAAEKQKVQARTQQHAATVGKKGAGHAAQTRNRGQQKIQNTQRQGEQKKVAAQRQGEHAKVEKAKSIAELKQRLDDSWKKQEADLKTSIDKQRAELKTKLDAERHRLDAEIKAQEAKLKAQIDLKNAELEKKIAAKKAELEKQAQAEVRKAEAQSRAEQLKIKTAGDAEARRIEKQGRTEADKVNQTGKSQAGSIRSKGKHDAASARHEGEVAANRLMAAVSGNDKDKDAAQKRAMQQASAARHAASNRAQQITSKSEAEAKKTEAEARAEAEKRTANAKELAAQAKATALQQATVLEGKLVETKAKLLDIGQKMESEKNALTAEVTKFVDAAKADFQKKTDESTVRLNEQEKQSLAKIDALEQTNKKTAQQKHDDMLIKLESGNAQQLAALEQETQKSIAEIEKTVTTAKMSVASEVNDAQAAAARATNDRIAAIQADGKRAIDKIVGKQHEAEARIEAAAQVAAQKIKTVAEKHEQETGAASAAAQVQLKQQGDKSVEDIKKSAADFERQKAEEAAKKAAEEKRKADEAAAHAAAEKKKQEDAKKAEEQKKLEFQNRTKGAADELFKAMDGFGTDEKKVFATLRGKTPEEMKAIKDAYKAKTGRELDSDLTSEMSGTELKEAKALLAQDPVTSAVAALQNSKGMLWNDKAKIQQTLDGIKDPELRAKVVDEYEKQTGERLNQFLADSNMQKRGVNPDDFKLEKKGPTLDPEEVKKLTESKDVKLAASAILAATDRWGTDETAVFTALKGKSPAEIAAIKAAFKEHSGGKDLEAVLEEELSTTDLKEAKALLSDDPVQKAVAQLENAADGWGTDKDKIHATLKDITDPELRKQVQAKYEQQTGQKLDVMLDDELSGFDRDLAHAYAKGNKADIAATEADKAMHGGWLTDVADGIADTVGADRKEMRASVAGPLMTMINGKDNATDMGTDNEALYAALESAKTPEERKALADAYKARTGKELATDVERDLDGSKEKDVGKYILAGDKASAEAAKMAAGASGIGTDRKAIYAALEKCESKEERERLVAKYNELYGKDGETFDQMLKGEMDELDYAKAKQLERSGKMDDGFALYYAMNEGFLGIGTDDDLLKERLRGKSKEEIAKLKEEYARAADTYGHRKNADLVADVTGETSGRAGHELSQSLKGNPTTLEEARQRAAEDYEFERHQSGWVGEVGMFVMTGGVGYGALKMMGVQPSDMSNGLTDMWSGSGKRLDQTHLDVEAEYLKIKNDPRYKDYDKYPPGSPERQQMDKEMLAQLQGKTDWQEGDLKGFQDAKDATADAAGTAVSLAVGAVITVASGGTAAPAVVALLSGLAGVGTTMMIKGASMSNEEVVQSVAAVIAETAAAGIVKIEKIDKLVSRLGSLAGGSNKFVAEMVKEACEEAIESGSEELINAMLDPELYKGDLADWAKGVTKKTGHAMGTGMLAGGVSAGAGDLMGDTKTVRGRLAKGAATQMIGSATTSAIDPGTYEGTVEDKWSRFGRSQLESAVRGARDSAGGHHGGEHGSHADTHTDSHTDTHSKGTETQTSTAAAGTSNTPANTSSHNTTTTTDTTTNATTTNATANAETTTNTEVTTKPETEQPAGLLPAPKPVLLLPGPKNTTTNPEVKTETSTDQTTTDQTTTTPEVKTETESTETESEQKPIALLPPPKQPLLLPPHVDTNTAAPTTELSTKVDTTHTDTETTTDTTLSSKAQDLQTTTDTTAEQKPAGGLGKQLGENVKSFFAKVGSLFTRSKTDVDTSNEPPALRTDFKGVEPGTMPEGLSAEQKKAFEAANEAFVRLRDNKFQIYGEQFAKLAWAQMLNEAGITVETGVTETGKKDRAVEATDVLDREAKQPQFPAEQTLSSDASMGQRSPTAPDLHRDEAAAAFMEVAKSLRGVEVKSVEGSDGKMRLVVEVNGPDNTKQLLTIRMLHPDVLPDGQLAGMMKGDNEVFVWLSKRTPNDQVNRALGGIIQQAIASRTGADTKHAGQSGQLDAMFSKLEKLKTTPEPTYSTDSKDLLNNQIAKSKRENPSRVQAEIDLLIAQMGIDKPGPEGEAALEQLPWAMQSEVKKYLATRQQSIGFNPDAVVDQSQVATPGTQQGSSQVLAVAPEATHPYSEADRAKVLELRVVMEQIAECDARLKERDVKGTQQKGQNKIAEGESLRRRELINRQKALLADLQLGGTDKAYYEQRLAELDAVFPGVSTTIKPTIDRRLEAHQQAEKAKAEAAQYREKALAASQKIEETLKSAKDPFLGGRMIVGDGIAGLSDLATLDHKAGKDGFLDPTDCLVVGGLDLVSRMAKSDGNMKWGQRAGLFDPESGEQKGHQIFTDEDGNSTGELQRRNEDDGDFMTVGELSDAMDLARQRMGVARVQAKVMKVEVEGNGRGEPWPAEAKGHPVRVTLQFADGSTKAIYLQHADLTVGLGQAMLSDQAVLSNKDKDELFKNNVLVGGEELMTGRDVKDKRVLVIGYGPTGGWASYEAAKRGAAAVDWTGSSGQAVGHEKDNASGLKGLKTVDRVQEAFDPENKVNISADRVLKIKPNGTGAEVTFVRQGDNGQLETYTVYYDHVVMALPPNNTGKERTTQGEMANAGTILEGVDMQPQARKEDGTAAPVLESKNNNGAVRVLGSAAADGVNLSDEHQKEMKQRSKQVELSADSPDNRVMEFAGEAAEMANKDSKRRNAEDKLSSSVGKIENTFGSDLAGTDTKLVGPTDSEKPVLQKGPEDALIGLPMDVIPATATGPEALALMEQQGIPRWPLLTEKERAHESAFLSELEAPGAMAEMVERFTQMSRDSNGVMIFEVDGAKKLYSQYGQKKGAENDAQADVRATANHALHPAAVAITRLAFLKALDEIAGLPENDPRRNVFVTNGGCAAGKGSLTDIVKGQNGGQFPFGAVWDAAGEGDAQENGWILQAAQQRGLKVTYGFVQNDPMFTYNAVLNRALGSGRIVDPITFARSYARGQQNMQDFLESDEYKAAQASGQAETIGMYTGKFDTTTNTYPDAKKLGDENGNITSGDIKGAPDEAQVTTAAIDIFEKWIEQQRAAGKPVQHWIEGGLTNTLKFDPKAEAHREPDTGPLDPARHASPLDETLASADVKSKLEHDGFVRLGAGNGDVAFVSPFMGEGVQAGRLEQMLDSGKVDATQQDERHMGFDSKVSGLDVQSPASGFEQSRQSGVRYLVYGTMPADQIRYGQEVRGGVNQNAGFNHGLAASISRDNVSMIIDTQSPVYQQVFRGMIIEQFLAEVDREAQLKQGQPRSAMQIINEPRAQTYTTNEDYLKGYVAWKQLVQGVTISPEQARQEIQARIGKNFDASGHSVGSADSMWSGAVMEQGKQDHENLPKPAPKPTDQQPERAPRPERPPQASQLRKIAEAVPAYLGVTFNLVADQLMKLFRHRPEAETGEAPGVVSERQVDGDQTQTPGSGDGKFLMQELDDNTMRVLLNLRLKPQEGVTPAELEKVKNQAREAMATYWDRQFTITGADGIPKLLRFDVDFVDTGWHHEVEVMKGGMMSRDHSTGWYTGSSTHTKGHEMGHLMGLPDEYFAGLGDSSGEYWTERQRMTSPYVKWDMGIMGHGSRTLERYGDMMMDVASTKDEKIDAAVAGSVRMPELPAGQTAKGLGETLGWGRTNEDALARANTITKADLQTAGLTAEQAKQWVAFFRDGAKRHPESPSDGRATLMERAARLLGS